MSSELKRWKRWAQLEAENMARTYYENKYLMLSSQIEIAMAKLIVLETIVNKVQFVLDGGDMEKVKNIIFEPSIEMLASSKFQSHVERSRRGGISASSPTSPSLSAITPSSATTPTMLSLASSIQKKMNRIPAITSTSNPTPTVSSSLSEHSLNAFNSFTPSNAPNQEQLEADNDNATNQKEDENPLVLEYVFRNPNSLSLPPEIAALEDALPTLIDVESKLRIQYENTMKKIMVQHIPSERANIYRQLILKGFKCKYLIRSDNFHYHPPDDKGLQVEFNCLLIDDRYPEGKLLRKWRKEIQRKFAKAQRAKMRRQRADRSKHDLKEHSVSVSGISKTLEVEQSQNSQQQQHPLEDHGSTQSVVIPEEDEKEELLDEVLVSADDVGEFLQNVTKLILDQYPIYQRDDWDPTSLDDKDVSKLEDIATMHRYGMKYKDTFYALKLYLDRLVFPRLTFAMDSEKMPIWFCLYSESEREHDALFRSNCEWMRTLSQSAMSIPIPYQKQYGLSSQWNSRLAVKNDVIHPELPYYDAILSFNRSKNFFVPNDMLYCWIEGLRLINAAASEYKHKNDIIRYEMDRNEGHSKGGKSALTTIEEEQGDGDGDGAPDVMNDDDDEAEENGDAMARMIEIHSRTHSMATSPVEKSNVNLSADEMFPILTWIIIHCRIDDIHMRLGFLDKFLDENDKYHGETGICYALVHQAAEWVRKKEGWFHQGTDAELDADHTVSTMQRNEGSMGDDSLVEQQELAPLKDHQEVEL